MLLITAMAGSIQIELVWISLPLNYWFFVHNTRPSLNFPIYDLIAFWEKREALPNFIWISDLSCSTFKRQTISIIKHIAESNMIFINYAKLSAPLALLVLATVTSGQVKSPKEFLTSQQQSSQQNLQPFQQQTLDFDVIRQQQRQLMQQKQPPIPQQQLQQQAQARPEGPSNNQQKQNIPPPQQPLQQPQQQMPMKSRQLKVIQPLLREGIRVTLMEPSAGYSRLENMVSVLDRVAYAISKPATIANVVRFVTLALSSLIMSSIIFPISALFDLTKKRNRERLQRYNPLNYISRQDIENMIDSMSKNYDDTLNRAGLLEKGSCRERSLCVLGDMVSCEFPNAVVTVGKFAQNHLPPIDVQKNKYTKALVLGLNQTDCDQTYKLNEYECPTFRDYVRSYFYGGVRRRRDHNYWRRQW